MISFFHGFAMRLSVFITLLGDSLMKTSIKKCFAAVGSAVALGPAVLFGQEGANPIQTQQLVDPSDVQSALTAELGDWILVGIGIGISVFIVYLGWRLLKRFTK